MSRAALKLTGVHVLILDDELAPLLAKAVEQMGGTAEPFRTLSAARERLAEDPEFFDCVVVDLYINGKGSDLIRELRLTRPGLPCVLLSGMDTQTVLKESLDCVFLAKPVTHGSLAEAINRAIGEAKTDPPQGF